MKRKLLSFFLAVIIVSLLSAGCSSMFTGNGNGSPYKEFIVVDVFDSLANYQGIQSGWFAKIVKDKFNMELNIIAPNKCDGGENLFNIRTASGNLGDLIVCSTENGHFQDLVDEGLILNMSEMLKDKQVMRYSSAINTVNDKLTQEGIYGVPSEISSLPASQSSEGPELTFGPYLRWDLYASIGYPRMTTLEDLLPVLSEMQKAMPETKSGKKTYGFSFFKDWDGNMMNAAKQPACFYGYDEIGFVLAKADGSDYQNIMDSDSLYMRILKLFFQANQMGLVDPESATQSWDDAFLKYKDGSILYSPWPYQGQSAFNTSDNKALGKGYMLTSIDDMQIFSYGCNPNGNQKTVIAVGSQAKDPQRMADFIDWLYSPEGIQAGCAEPSNGTAGPEGLTWEMEDDGPHLTDFGKKALLGKNTVVPEEWGGGLWEEGVSQLNYKPVSQNDLDSNGYPYYYKLWDSFQEMQSTPLDMDWKAHMNNENSSHDYLEHNNMMIVAPGSNYVMPDMSSELKTIRSQCSNIIVDYSWKMVFAPNEYVFDTMLEEMQKKIKAYGYEKIYKEDLKCAKDQDAARKESAGLSGK